MDVCFVQWVCVCDCFSALRNMIDFRIKISILGESSQIDLFRRVDFSVLKSQYLSSVSSLMSEFKISHLAFLHKIK